VRVGQDCARRVDPFSEELEKDCSERGLALLGAVILLFIDAHSVESTGERALTVISRSSVADSRIDYPSRMWVVSRMANCVPALAKALSALAAKVTAGNVTNSSFANPPLF
jgi:hypothetical protein